MNVQSLVWIGWAAGAVTGHWLTPARWRDVFVVGVTLLFLCVYSPVSALLLTSLSIATYVATERRPVSGVSVAMLASVVIILLLGYKISAGPLDFTSAPGLVIPLGLSYYTLRCVHYAIECYKGTIPKQRFADLVAYQFFCRPSSLGRSIAFLSSNETDIAAVGMQACFRQVWNGCSSDSRKSLCWEIFWCRKSWANGSRPM